MFDDTVTTRLAQAAAAACANDYAYASPDQLRTVLRTVQTAMDTLAGVHARATGAFEAAAGPGTDGCSTVGVWLQRELRLTRAEVRRRRRAAAALKGLDEVRAAADAGEIRPEHVDVFAEGIRRVGEPTMIAAQHVLLPVARSCDPSELLKAVEHLHHASDPDGPDREWAKAQEKQDITCRRVGYGWDVRGFLDADTGAKLHLALKSWGAPVGDDGDDRPVARRRVEGLNTLLTDYLGFGLPVDKGIRPHLNVTIDIDTLRLALSGDRTTPTAAPATFAGFGVIGRDLLARVACDPTLTVMLTDSTTDQHRCTADRATHGDAGHYGDAEHYGDDVRHRCGCPVTPYVHVLDVGRSERIATRQQRLAVLTAQGFRCATPGCNNQHLEIHHIISWLDGGPTDMDNVIGLCSACHTLLHRRLLVCTSDGHGGARFTRADGQPISDIRRHSLVAYAEQLRDHVSATLLKQQGGRPRSRGHPPGNDQRSDAA